MKIFGRKRAPSSEPPARDAERPRVVVTGIGPVTAIGCGRNDFYQGLLEKRTGFGPITLCDVSRSPAKIAAEVKGFRMEDYVEHGRAIERWAPRPMQFALAAAVMALHDSELELRSVPPDRLGLIVGTGTGNVHEVVEMGARWRAGEAAPAHSSFVAIHHSIACVVSSFLDLRGVSHTVSSGCNSGIDGLGQALRVIQAGGADAVLVVGTDCEVVPEVIASLNASHSLATSFNDDPERASRPFDVDRDGNVIGEGACALLLEREDHAVARGARIYARAAGYHLAASGGGRRYSHDRPDLEPETAVRAMEGARRDAGWGEKPIDLVNANGSSSKLYDPLESHAIAAVVGDRETPVHSIKSMLGQHGAGSSALQCAAACLAIRREVAPPTANHERLDPACAPIKVLVEPLVRELDRVLVHSIGLGGFYYSAAAFERGNWDSDQNLTGLGRVAWSSQHHPRHLPAPEYQKPLEPWKPLGDFRPDGA